MPEFPESLRIFDIGSAKNLDHPMIRELRNRGLQRLLEFTDQAVIIMNHTSLEYVFVSENVKTILGYEVDEWTRLGAGGMSAFIHPDDLRTMGDVIFPEYFRHLGKLSDEDKFNMRCAYTYRMRHKEGHYVQIAQQNIILSLENDKIGLGLIVLNDHSAFKKNNDIYYNVVLVRHPDVHEVLVNKTSSDGLLTSREVDVLRMMSKGLTEKQVADKLHVSINTVKTHKRNMIRKTGVRNSVELVRFGMANFLM